ncbi:MAG: WYL domain-containing protein [Clostridia bacterium]|nr:WYL domain-containing protein [Clostridia bacterium]
MQNYWKKIKLLKLVELLWKESDEQHPLTTNYICEYMNGIGITCDRRVVTQDVALLNELGYEVLSVQVGKKKGYYLAEREFSVPELKILIDAVQAAGFITEKKTDELIDKIAKLGGAHKAEILKNNLVCFNTRKHSNESIYYNVDALEEALQRYKKVIFRYFDIGIEREKIYRRDGHHYVVEPVALVYNEDNYYLVAYSEKHDSTANYRVDRMDGVGVIDDDISDKALTLRGDVAQYTEQAFKMYGGEAKTVVLEFAGDLAGAVYDRFGESVNMLAAVDDKIISTVDVQLSPTFWGWIFQFGKKMRIISPDDVCEKYRAKAAEVLNSDNKAGCENMKSFNLKESIQTPDELEFAVFCIENLARKLNKDAENVYTALSESGILNGYIIPEYEVLHTQGMEYILEDILEVMKERGVEV